MIEAIDKPDILDSNKLVSIIIPVFNVRPYLVEALDSVLQQTYENLEIIIIDDGSTDGSGKICDEYAARDTRVFVIHQENRGLSAARNVGLDKMSGEFVAFLDSDDAYHSNYVKVMMDAMIRERADLVVCQYVAQYTTGKMHFGDNKKTVPMIAAGVYDRVEALRALADRAISVAVWDKLYSRKLWREVRFPDRHVYEDLDTSYRIIDFCKIVYFVDSPLYLHRQRPRSISDTASWINFNDRIRAFSHFSSFIEANIPQIFSAEQLKKNRQLCFQGMIVFYLRRSGKTKADREPLDEDLRRMIIDKGKEIEVETCNLRTKVAYKMLCVCPNILRIIYSLYRLGRPFIFKNV